MAAWCWEPACCTCFQHFSCHWQKISRSDQRNEMKVSSVRFTSCACTRYTNHKFKKQDEMVLKLSKWTKMLCTHFSYNEEITGLKAWQTLCEGENACTSVDNTHIKNFCHVDESEISNTCGIKVCQPVIQNTFISSQTLSNTDLMCDPRLNTHSCMLPLATDCEKIQGVWPFTTDPAWRYMSLFNMIGFW